MSGLVEFLQEDNGGLSSMRIIVLLIVIVVLINWTWINIKTGDLTPMNWDGVMLIIGPLMAKAWQKGKEAK